MSTDITQNLKTATESLKDSDLPQKVVDKARQVSSSITAGRTSLATTNDLRADYASLCMLSYNRPKFLKESLEGIEKNTRSPFELIIHDDGSTDEGVYEVLSALGKATVITNPEGHNQGQGIALNRMFSMAKGDPIIKLDQDLRYYPGWLLEVRRLMTEYPCIGLLGLLHYYHEPVDSRKTVRVRHDEWSEHTHILGSAFAMRRECWEELGPFDEHSEAFAEDYIMQVKVAESEKWKCALPKESLVENLGMGIPHSTVVEATGGVHKIHKTPFVIYTE